MTLTPYALNDDASAWLARLAPMDLVVGIPSYNSVSTIGYVIQAVATGLARHFPGLRAVIINMDGGSLDGTRSVVRNAVAPEKLPVVSMTYQGPPGKGSAFRAAFQAVASLNARAAAVVDSDLRSISPQWIDRLLSPVLRDGFDFVAPLYTRHKYDGAITNNVAYPMTRMLYGLDLRQPLGGDFGFSGQLARWWLDEDVWDTDVARLGIDIFMATTAITEGFQVGQTSLGLKLHDATDPAASLGPMFTQVVGTLFDLMERYAYRWQTIQYVWGAPVIGNVPTGEPEPLVVSVPALLMKFGEGLAVHAATLEQVLPAERHSAIHHLTRQRGEDLLFSASLWAELMIDFAVSAHRATTGREQLLAALVPLYCGRVAAMVEEAEHLDAAGSEREIVQRQAETFHRLKPELIRRWNETP
jgi:glucosylglycerate synthase